MDIAVNPRHSVLTVSGGKALAREVARSIGLAAQTRALAYGGKSFWADVANSVNAQNPDETPNGWIVGASHVAGAHKQFGGVISAPGKGKGSLKREYLTIPVGVAREKRWSVENAQVQGGYTLFRVKAKSGKVLLFGYRAELKKRRVELLFILKKSVWQRAYPWWPDGSVLAQAIERGIRAHGALNGGA